MRHPCEKPQPCGYYGDVFRQCSCTSTQVQKYQKRISGPLLDRIDLHVAVPRLSEELLQSQAGESSAAIRERVCRARAMQAKLIQSGRKAVLPNELYRRLLSTLICKDLCLCSEARSIICYMI